VGALVHLGAADQPFEGRSAEDGPRVRAFFAFLWTYVVLSSSRESYVWIVSAGCLAGPALALLPVACWSTKPPPPEGKVSCDAVGGAFVPIRRGPFVSDVGRRRGQEFPALPLRRADLGGRGDLWVNAHGFVRFMTVGTACLHLGVLTHVGCAETGAVRKTLMRSLVLGPGAALVAVARAELEPERSSVFARTKKE
jgi:hypothetical protein